MDPHPLHKLHDQDHNPNSIPVNFPPSSANSILENVNSAPIPAPNPAAAQSLQIRQVYLRDHVTQATIYPITSAAQLSTKIISILQQELNGEIQRGDTYPMEELMDFDKFVSYWFGTFAAVILEGKPEDHGDLTVERDWMDLVLGTFYIKPNYPGRFNVQWWFLVRAGANQMRTQGGARTSPMEAS
jgi:hypothetical protein